MARLEVRLVERHDVVARDRGERILRRHAAVRMVGTVEQLWVYHARDAGRAVARLREIHDRAATQPVERFLRKRRIEQDIGENHERGRELVLRRLECDLSRLTADECADVRAEQLEVGRDLVAGSVRRAFRHHLADETRESGLVRRFVLVRAADEVDDERHEGKVVLLRHHELGAVRQRRLLSTWNAQRGGLRGRRDHAAVELCLWSLRDARRERKRRPRARE